jgi:hypothetical protein
VRHALATALILLAGQSPQADPVRATERIATPDWIVLDSSGAARSVAVIPRSTEPILITPGDTATTVLVVTESRATRITSIPWSQLATTTTIPIGPTPTPQPTPPPTPTPQPIPVPPSTMTGHIYIAFVSPTTASDIVVGQFRLRATDIQSRLATLDAEYHTFATGSDEAKKYGLAGGGDTPAFFAWTRTDKPVMMLMDTKTTIDDLVAWVRKVGGR